MSKKPANRSVQFERKTGITEDVLPIFEYTDDTLHDYWRFFQQAKAPFDRWLESNDDTIVANALIVLLQRTMAMMANQIKKLGDDFLETGGFRERMYQCRNDVRDGNSQQNEPSPDCPQCAKPMRLRNIRQGKNVGNSFWGCTRSPECRGTREMTEGP